MLYNYSETVEGLIIKPVFKINKKASLNLYSRVILAGIKRDLIIFK
jgi:hypothetical protein